MKQDDTQLDPSSAKQVRKYADLLLQKANAYGRFPTPIDDLVAASQLEIARENALDTVFLGNLYRRLPNSVKLMPDRIKKAIDKVVGILDRADRTIHLAPDLHPKKIPFVSIHEVGHDALPWQRRVFDLLEDSKSELEPDTRDRFEQEANCFAGDVLFQLDQFTVDAADCDLAIKTPISLARRYGTSLYSTIRRYVATHANPCVLFVFEKEEIQVGDKPALSLRRVIASVKFAARFGNREWPDGAVAGTFFYSHKPRGKFTYPAACSLQDLNGDAVECLIEAFDSSFQIFFILYPLIAVSRKSTFVLASH